MWKYLTICALYYFISAVSVVDNKEITLKCNSTGFEGEVIAYFECGLSKVTSPKDELTVIFSNLEVNKWIAKNFTVYVDIVGNSNYPEYLPGGLTRFINGTGGFTYKNSPLKYIQRSNFMDMAPSLFLIILEDNKIEEIPFDTFYDLPYFQYLDVRKNRIKSLEPNLFAAAPYFTTLIIENNQLSNLHPDLFKNNQDFNVLYAEFNEIDELHAELLKNNPKMSIISMRHNKISHIPLDFGKFEELQVADFTHNAGTCDTMFFTFQPYPEYYDETEQKKWIKTVPEFQKKINEICRSTK